MVKSKRNPSEIRTKARMSTLTTFIQYIFGILSHSNQMGEKKIHIVKEEANHHYLQCVCFVLFLVSYYCYNKLSQTSFLICESHSVVSESLRPHGLYSPWNSPGQDTGVYSFFLLQGIFPSQGLNPGLPHCRWILYQLSHKRSPHRVL